MNVLQVSHVVGYGLLPILREKLNAQYDYILKMAPYLHLAKAVGEEEDFFSTFFKVWFERWPETPTDNSDGGISSVEDMKEIVKKEVKRDYRFILIGIDVGISERDWRAGFADEEAVDDDTSAFGPGSDFINVDNDAFLASSGSDLITFEDDKTIDTCSVGDDLENMVYVSSDEDIIDASISICP